MGSASTSTPSSTTTGSAHPSAVSAGLAASTSARAEAPFMATSSPLGSTSGRHQRASRSRGATARAVTTSNVARPGQLLGSAADHLDLVLETELLDDLVEEARPAQQRLDQRHPQVRPGDRQHHAGQAGARADVGHARRLRHQLGQHRAVEEVPLPQPGSLARADQAPDHALGREQLGVPLGERQPADSEHPPRLGGHGGCFT